jgi:hypothetical protein
MSVLINNFLPNEPRIHLKYLKYWESNQGSAELQVLWNYWQGDLGDLNIKSLS